MSPRGETTIIAELRDLCQSPGYAHAIAYFCFRNNILTYTENFKTVTPLSFNRLIRTEISTLIALALEGKFDIQMPSEELLSDYVSKTEILLEELHHCLAQPMFEKAKADLAKGEADVWGGDGWQSFVREPIFYSSESAYPYQYKDLFVEKYQKDEA